MKTINEGNKKMLETLQKVQPAVGKMEEWKRHERRSRSIQRLTKG